MDNTPSQKKYDASAQLTYLREQTDIVKEANKAFLQTYAEKQVELEKLDSKSTVDIQAFSKDNDEKAYKD